MPELAYETKCRICGKWYRAQTDASAICHPCAEARVAELEAELARVQRLPELEWAQVTASIAQHIAAISRQGFHVDSKGMMDALDRGKTYVNRILSSR